MAGIPPTEFCGLRSNMYSLAMLTGNREYRKAKSMPKAYVRKHVDHEQYLHVLCHWFGTTCRYHVFHSRNHGVTTSISSKVRLSCIDDKRYLLPDAIHSLAYKHCDIAVAAATI